MSLLDGKAMYTGKKPDFIKEKPCYENGKHPFQKEIKFIKKMC